MDQERVPEQVPERNPKKHTGLKPPFPPIPKSPDGGPRLFSRGFSWSALGAWSQVDSLWSFVIPKSPGTNT